MRSTRAILPVLLGLLAAGCGNGDQDTPGGPDHSAEIPLPCFADEGPIVCRIDGVPVPRASFERYLGIFKEINPAASELRAGTGTLERILIPSARRYAAAGDAVRVLSERAWEAYDRIAYGREPFEEVAARYNSEEKLAAAGGLVGTFDKDSKELAAMGAEFRHRFWNWPEGVPSPPFVEHYGILILKITGDVRNESQGIHKRTVRLIRFPWPGEAPSGLASVTDIADEAFGRFVPGVYRRS